MTRHGDAEDRRGKTLEKWIRWLNEYFKGSLKNLRRKRTKGRKERGVLKDWV